jgi:hypothetical protein
VVGTTATSGAIPALGTLVTATATCAVGKVLLGGGARVTGGGGAVVKASYPSSTTTWTAVGEVELVLLGTFSVTAYALCSQ